MNDLKYTVAPILAWPELLTSDRRRSTFTAPWSGRGYESWQTDNSTLGILSRELFYLDGKHVVMQIAVRDKDIRLDGQVKANARTAEHPGVILTFDSKHGRLSYPCDRYDHWQDNVRGIALSLEALRSVNRHGVTRHGEQYAGSRQIPSSTGGVGEMTPTLAAEVLVDAEDRGGDAADLLHDPQAVKYTYHNAAKATHPDRHGGSGERFQIIERAKAVLDAHHG